MTHIQVLRTGPFIVEDRSWLGDVDGTPATRPATLLVSAFTANTHYPNRVIMSGTVLGQFASGPNVGLWGPYAGATDEQQTVTITGAPGGGTFTLTFDGATTAAIAYNAAASAVQSALEALPNITAGQVAVSGSAGGPYTVTFTGGLGGTNVAAMTASGASLTGGTSPGVTIATATAGGSTASTGLETPRGFLFDSTQVIDEGTTITKVSVPLLERGFIKPAKLPANHGLDATARRLLANHFIFRDFS